MINRVIRILLSVILISCAKSNREVIVDKTKLTGDDYRLFQSTPAWKLAKAVWDEDVLEIDKIVSKNPQLINFQEPIYGSTLLMLTIKNQQYKSFEILLKDKANVHIHDTYEGSTALIESCSSKYYDINFPKTLLQYEANVNDVQTDVEKKGKTRTSLMLASRSGLIDFIELLIDKGAEINYQNEYKQSALSMAVMHNNYEVVVYLLKKGADYKKPIFFREDQNKNMYLVDVLKEDFFDLDTDEYKYKMEIVEFLKSKGIDYKATPIPEYIKKKAQERYPSSWQEYLEKY